MNIESGTTKWWRNRHLMFLVMFLAFAAYFAYDGFYAWPRANVKWAAQAMGVPPETVQANPRVNTTAIRQVNGGLKQKGAVDFEALVGELKLQLGEPTLARENEYWWVGPAMYVEAAVRNGKPELIVEQSKEYAESSIRDQKWFALLLSVAAAVVFFKLMRVLRMRAVLDEGGLHYKGRDVPWDAMTGLRTADYDRKGWVDLEYTAGGVTRSFRIDSFHIEKFDEIINAICERKGFKSPVAATGNTGTTEDEAPPEA